MASATLKIVKAYIRRYSDTGQVIAYVEWSNGSLTEGHPYRMSPLLERAAIEEDLEIEYQVW